MTARIRWQAPVLWPEVQRQIPAGFTVVTDRRQAAKRGRAAFRGLPPRQREQYGLLWAAALDDGFQPSGLLLVCLSALSPVLGHTTVTVPKRFGRFCTDVGLWCRVPGRLYPVARHLAPGERTRCYVVLAPDPRLFDDQG